MSVNASIESYAVRGTLERLRAECDRWLTEAGDLGEISETEMVSAWYPGGVPQVPAPLLIPITPSDPGSTPVHGHPVEIEGPALIQLHSGIQGASIEYRLDDDPHWLLYCGPIAVQPAQSLTVHARADRIGYEPSPEISVQIICTDH